MISVCLLNRAGAMLCKSGVIKISYDITALQTEIQLQSIFLCLLLFHLKCITHLSCLCYNLTKPLCNEWNFFTHLSENEETCFTVYKLSTHQLVFFTVRALVGMAINRSRLLFSSLSSRAPCCVVMFVSC